MSPGEVRRRLEALLRAEFTLDDRPLTDDTGLASELLIDSLAMVELAMVVEDELEIGLGDTRVAEIRTFGHLCDAVSERVAGRSGRAESVRIPRPTRH